MTRCLRQHLNLLAAALLATACAGLPVATLQLPAQLQGSQPLMMAGVSAGREGRFAFDGGAVRFDRGADRLALFDRVSRERATLQLEWQPADRPPTRLNCRSSRTEVSALGVDTAVRPLRLACEGDAGQTLTLAERPAALGAPREGEFRHGSVRLQLRSLHRVAGSPLPLAGPAGYALLHEGRTVAAVERLSPVPRLWRADADPAVREAATQAALVLALAWEAGEGAAP